MSKRKPKTLVLAPVRLDQIQLISDIGKAISKQVPNIATEARTFNAIISAANMLVAELGRESIKATPGMGLNEWLRSHDTGMSSLFMASILCGHGIAPQRANVVDHPHDPADFGRCYRFLQAVAHEIDQSTWKQRMAEQSKQWAALVDKWEDLAILYTQGEHVHLTKLMHAIIYPKQ